LDDVRRPVLVVVGPTAVGKTAFAIRLAKAVDGEVVSADAVQVYRGLDVGTAKPPLAAREGVPHHLLDVADPHGTWMDAHTFARLAAEALADIHRRGRVPIVAGGTGLYIRAALGEWRFDGPPPDPVRRRLWRQKAQAEGVPALWEVLRQRDPAKAAALSPHDLPRIVRALEGGGRGERVASPYRLLKFFLWRPRAELYRRIDERAAAQWAGGLLDEALTLLDLPEEAPPARALGYREGRWFWRGLVTWAEGLRLYQRNTRHLAKRQLTWWRRETDLVPVAAGTDEEDVAIARALRFLGDQP
jgi:tRNA dimethylallyltransferase